MPAPSFAKDALVHGIFSKISLEQFRGRYLVLFFYPLNFTFVCPTEITAFSDRVDEFRRIGCEVIAASVDSVHSHLAWSRRPRQSGGLGAMNIPLLSDINQSLCKSYGVLTDEGIATRGIFIIDTFGRLRNKSVNDLPVGRSVDETLRVVQACQYSDIHKEEYDIHAPPKRLFQTHKQDDNMFQ
jgi:alkyl hydroperoxide reductase subunit AhpC